METSAPPHPALNLSTDLYYQLVYTLTDLLPPPLDASPEALRTRNHAAIAKVAALLPVNANEADLAAQCIAARAQAEDVLRLLRENANDINLVMRLNAQYASMVRTSLSVHARLARVQTARQKREAIGGAATQDAWILHIAEESMLKVADPDIERLAAEAPRQVAKPAPVAAPTAQQDQTTKANVSANKPNSHNMAFETQMSRQPRNQSLAKPAEPDLPSQRDDRIASDARELPAPTVAQVPSGQAAPVSRLNVRMARTGAMEAASRLNLPQHHHASTTTPIQPADRNFASRQ